jgi:hypothetical protein
MQSNAGTTTQNAQHVALFYGCGSDPVTQRKGLVDGFDGIQVAGGEMARQEDLGVRALAQAAEVFEVGGFERGRVGAALKGWSVVVESTTQWCPEAGVGGRRPVGSPRHRRLVVAIFFIRFYCY